MTAKLKKCPKCGNTDLNDRWVAGRKLQQSCGAVDEDEELSKEDTHKEFNYHTGMWVRVCNWEGEPRTPETIKITAMRPAWAAARGSSYEIYDRFGHCMSNCGMVDMAEINLRLAQGLADTNAGPYKAVVWKGDVRKGRIYDGSTNPPTLVVPTKSRTKDDLVRDLEDLCRIWEARLANNNDEGRVEANCASRVRDILSRG